MARGAPERPVVLRRLGILKDEFDTEVVRPQASAGETADEGLEPFGSETRSPEPRFAGGLTFANRYPRVAVAVVAAVMLVGGVLTINALFGSAPPPVGPSADAAAPASTEAPASAGEASSDSDALLKSATAATVNPDASRVAAVSGRRPEDQDRSVDAPASTTPGENTLKDSEVLSNAPPSSAGETIAPDPTLTPLTIVDDRIYSAEDADVVPPQTSEMLLPGPTISAWSTRTNAMELIVSQTGAVEHVRLLTMPQRMPDVLVLSRAKVWKFTPAMKDGRPVRYRLRVTWEVNP
jgi:hypothetical protein